MYRSTKATHLPTCSPKYTRRIPFSPREAWATFTHKRLDQIIQASPNTMLNNKIPAKPRSGVEEKMLDAFSLRLMTKCTRQAGSGSSQPRRGTTTPNRAESEEMRITAAQHSRTPGRAVCSQAGQTLDVYLWECMMFQETKAPGRRGDAQASAIAIPSEDRQILS